MSETNNFVFSLNGRLVFLCYLDTAEAVFYTYDPATEAWTGPHAGPSPNWSWHSYTFGDSRWYGLWGSKYIVGYGMTVGYYYTSSFFCYIDEEFTYHEITPSWPIGSTLHQAMGGGNFGVYRNAPAKLVWEIYTLGGVGHLDIEIIGVGGSLARFDASSLYRYTISGSTGWPGNPCGPGWTWGNNQAGCTPNGAFYFTSPPTVANICSPQGYYHPLEDSPSNFYVVGDAVYSTMRGRAGIDPDIFADLTDPQTAMASPFSGVWDYYRQRDGLAYAIDGGDLDGQGHGVVGIPIGISPSYNAGAGWYVAAGVGSGIQATVYVLDPWQPTSWAGWPAAASNGSIAWVGEAGINSRLRLREVLPLGRTASLSARAAVEIPTRTYLQDSLIRKGAAAAEPLIVNLDGYPTTDLDWWFPGSDGDHYDGFWDIFAHDGTNLVIARMPDPSWGMLSPLGADVMYSMGRVTESPDFTVSVQGSMKVDGTTFAGPIAGTYHRQLIGCRELHQFVWLESNTGGFQSPPQWEAKVGHLVQASSTHWDWVTDIDFKGREPGLGEDGGVHENWTVWCVQPIPPCRPLPRGGWLVGATLYFAPWGTSWAWDIGSRDATFRDSGLGYVPSLPSYLGPVEVENTPAYFVDLDEWTMARAIYGADALLVYDETGAFVECLSDATTYPANGKAFAVTSGMFPKVIYRVYRWSQYSDSAEYWGCWQNGAGDDDLNVGMWACYDLFSGRTIQPGFGAFRGFVDPSGVSANNLEAPPWRWSTIAANLYNTTYPKLIYPGPGSGEMRAGTGGLTVTPLTPGSLSSRQGVKGVGQRV
ncbi:MAG: hypothetical protein M1565_00830 [Actinobacteria bacterium]|nr:hypothetical protein [Actinomycetota bacterium]